jgi:hypothetical protein
VLCGGESYLINATIQIVVHTYYKNDGYTAEELPASRHQRRSGIMWECKIIPEHTMKAYDSSGNGGKSPLILNVTTICMWVVIFTLRPLYLREKNT